MHLFYLMMVLSGVHISISLTSTGLYVKQYFNGSGRIATITTIFHMMPWTLKFIYGFLIDHLLPTTKKKLKLLVYLPVFLFVFSVAPLLFTFTITQFYAFVFLISVPNAVFHTAFYSYFYQGIRVGVYDKSIFSKALSCHFTGSLIGNSIYFLISLLYMKDLETTIYIAFITISFVSVFLILVNTILYKNRMQDGIDFENRVKDLGDEVVENSQKNWLDLLRAMFNLIKQKNYNKVLLFLIVFSFVPTYTSYYPMFLLSKTSHGGLGAHQSSYILSRIVYYITSITGPYLYILYRKKRNGQNIETVECGEEAHLPMWFKQEVVFIFFTTLSFIMYISEALYYIRNVNSGFVKVLFYQCFVFIVALLLSMRTVAIFEFVCDSYVEGLEGSLYSIWSSFLYLSAIISDLLGLCLVLLFDKLYGYGKQNMLKWDSLKPATYISYIVNTVCILYGYYMY